MSDGPKYPPVWAHRHEDGTFYGYRASAPVDDPFDDEYEPGHFLPADDARRLVEARAELDMSRSMGGDVTAKAKLDDIIDRLGLDLDK